MSTESKISGVSRSESARAESPLLSWRLADIERKFLFPGEPFTQVNGLLAFIIGALLGTAFYAIVFALRDRVPKVYEILYLREWPVKVVCLFFCWGLVFLFLKWRKLALQRRALGVTIVPDDLSFVLSVTTAEDVLRRLHRQVDDVEAFTLSSRIHRALSSLKNMGRIADVDTVLRAQSDTDANLMESSYSLVKSLCWALPVLGFIGTVYGLSHSIGNFGGVLTNGNGDNEALRNSLKPVITQLSVAFDTTFVALGCTLILQMLLSALKKREEDFLAACDDYCHRSVITRLRTVTREERD